MFEQTIDCTERIGATEAQVDGIKDYECSEYEASLPDGDGDVPIGEEPPQGPEVKEEDNVRPDCEPPESTTLMFAKALKTNAGSEVESSYSGHHPLPRLSRPSNLQVSR